MRGRFHRIAVNQNARVEVLFLPALSLKFAINPAGNPGLVSAADVDETAHETEARKHVDYVGPLRGVVAAQYGAGGPPLTAFVMLADELRQQLNGHGRDCSNRRPIPANEPQADKLADVSNHPNRSKQNIRIGANPSPAEIARAREDAGLTQNSVRWSTKGCALRQLKRGEIARGMRRLGIVLPESKQT